MWLQPGKAEKMLLVINLELFKIHRSNARVRRRECLHRQLLLMLHRQESHWSCSNAACELVGHALAVNCDDAEEGDCYH